MARSIFSNVNTLGITYINGVIRKHHFEVIFDKIMGIPDSEIEAVDGRCDTRFIFKVTSKERYDDICLRFTGRDILLEHDLTIRVDDISTPGTMVELMRVPLNLTNDQLKILLSKFGNVNKCQSYFHRFGKYSNFSKSGHRIAWIDLKGHIPRTLKITETQNFLNVTYHEQPFSCNECGKTGHRARGCKTNPTDYINIIDSNLLLNKISVSPINVEVLDIETVDLDVHIGSSQSTNDFACKVCDYKCAYGNILDEHMRSHTTDEILQCNSNGIESTQQEDIHTEEFKCFICDTVSLSKTSYDEHLARHDVEIQLSCSECEFECLNQAVLDNHISSHNIYACKVCDFTFKTAKHLSEHGRIHNVDKLSCAKCDITFSSKTEFKKHKKQHTGEKTESVKRDHSISPEANVSNKKAALRSKQGSK